MDILQFNNTTVALCTVQIYEPAEVFTLYYFAIKWIEVHYSMFMRASGSIYDGINPNGIELEMILWSCWYMGVVLFYDWRRVNQKKRFSYTDCAITGTIHGSCYCKCCYGSGMKESFACVCICMSVLVGRVYRTSIINLHPQLWFSPGYNLFAALIIRYCVT